MKKKTKGFTILELIITLSLVVIVLGVVYTFFFSNSKTLTTTELNSDLQFEAEKIQDELLVVGTESKGISQVLYLGGLNITDESYNAISDMQAQEGKIEVNEIRFVDDNGYYELDYEGTNLTIRKLDNSGNELTEDGYPELLSKNVTNLYIRPIDYRMNNLGKFINAPGIEISIILKKNKGYSEVSLPVSTIVKFRNK
ncbi:prepilin-type N-terminal cleavage/methylation domain-containing protein [Caproiciproducens sp. MSJ-32]|nr:prepilin-type N-terminal cleavage/methylation domain-containing protein [Caproiciproducens sp. MSJ-32]MBU5455638.1 prepilin-type N-terminal cleavage/methylation domain-containing protein [Caproiciproducens sp. MSJ-32]